VIGLAEALNPAIEAGVKSAGAPKTVVGIAIGRTTLLQGVVFIILFFNYPFLSLVP
jgi:hypothetical protein